jgi:hypothetical protein
MGGRSRANPGRRLLDRCSHGGSVPQGEHNTAPDTGPGSCLRLALADGSRLRRGHVDVGVECIPPRHPGTADGLVAAVGFLGPWPLVSDGPWRTNRFRRQA